MTIEEIMSGESEYLEFKQMVPEKSETYMKTVVAFANGSGGRIIFGVENGTLFRFPDKMRIGKSTDKWIESTEKHGKVRIKSTDKSTKNRKKIIQYIEKKGTIANREVQNLLNVKDSRALKILREMVEAGILKKEGKLRGSCYKLK